jgi:hypothetical protein
MSNISLQETREAAANLLPYPAHCNPKFQDFYHYVLPVLEEKE